jgi:hypothetical protein
MSRPIFKTRRTEDPGKTHTGKMSSLRPVPYKRDPPRSLRLAQQVTASHNKSPPRTTSPGSDWCVGHDTRVEPGARAPPPKRVGERFPAPCKHTSWRSCKQLAPTRALMLVCPAARPSHQHHLPFCHTQAQPEALKHPL